MQGSQPRNRSYQQKKESGSQVRVPSQIKTSSQLVCQDSKEREIGRFPSGYVKREAPS